VFGVQQAHLQLTRFPPSQLSLIKLAEGFSRVSSLTGRIFSFWPETWVLPDSLSSVESVLSKNKRRKKKRTLILKPTSGSQGEGISLLQRVEDLKSATTVGGGSKGKR